MFHPLLAQLDDRLKHRGEWVFLQRKVGSTVQSLVQCRIKAIVNPLTVEQLVGAVTQQNWLVITSPTQILRAQWPGGKPQASGAQGGIIEPTDPSLPVTNDILFLRGAQKTLTQPAAIFDRGMCIRIEMKVLG